MLQEGSAPPRSYTDPGSHRSLFDRLSLWCKLNVPDWLCVSPRATSHYRSGFESSEHPTILETSDHTSILCPERMTRSCFRSEPGFPPLRKSLRTVDQRLTWVHGADSKPSICAAADSSNNLGNLRSIINISRLFIQSDLEGRLMLLLDNRASDFMKDECEPGFWFD